MISYAKLYKQKLQEEKENLHCQKNKNNNRQGVNFELLLDWDTSKKENVKDINEELQFNQNIPENKKFQNNNLVPIKKVPQLPPIKTGGFNNHNIVSSKNNINPNKGTCSLLNKFTSKAQNNPTTQTNSNTKYSNKIEEICQSCMEKEENTNNNLESLRANNAQELNPNNFYENYTSVSVNSNDKPKYDEVNRETPKISKKPSQKNNFNTISSIRANKSIKSIEDNDENLHCSIHDDSLNVTQQQMDDLNNEANALFKEMKKKYKKQKFDKKMQSKTESNQNLFSKKKKLGPLILKQKRIIKRSKPKLQQNSLININTTFPNAFQNQNNQGLRNQINVNYSIPYPMNIMMNPYQFPISPQYPYTNPQIPQIYPFIYGNTFGIQNQQAVPVYGAPEKIFTKNEKNIKKR